MGHGQLYGKISLPIKERKGCHRIIPIFLFIYLYILLFISDDVFVDSFNFSSYLFFPNRLRNLTKMKPRPQQCDKQSLNLACTSLYFVFFARVSGFVFMTVFSLFIYSLFAGQVGVFIIVVLGVTKIKQ